MNTSQFQQSANMQFSGNSTGWMAPAATKPSFWKRMLGIRANASLAEQETETDNPDSVLLDYNIGHSSRSEMDTRINGRETGVYVSKPVRSPLEAFKDAITDGTRLFCEQNVHPLYVEDKQTKFRVTGIKMYIPKSKNELMAVIEQLPIDVRNRLARLRAQNAPGAAEQLVFDEEFFGISIDIEPTVIDGQYVSLIASWAGTNVDIKMVFTGQYVTVKPPVEIKPDVATKRATDFKLERESMKIWMEQERADEIADRDRANETSINAAPNLSAVVKTDLTDQKLDGSKKLTVNTSEMQPELMEANRSKRDTTTVIDIAAKTRVSHDTPLNLPPRVKQGKDTYIPALGRHPVARIRLLAHGVEKETVLDICTDMLPFMIGREYTASGRFERGHNLGIDGDDPSVLMVSREHLELRSFDRNDSLFQVVNHAINKNGSFHNGCPLPNLFSFKAAGRQNVMVLGGTSGPGTVRVTFEAI